MERQPRWQVMLQAKKQADEEAAKKQADEEAAKKQAEEDDNPWGDLCQD